MFKYAESCANLSNKTSTSEHNRDLPNCHLPTKSLMYVKVIYDGIFSISNYDPCDLIYSEQYR